MNRFSGFPRKMRFTPVPNLFFSQVMPRIDDLTELKATLHIFWLVYQRKGYPRFVTYRELTGDAALMSGTGGVAPSEALRRGLDLAVGRGTLLHLKMERDGEVEDLYFINTEVDRRAVARIEGGELKLGALSQAEPYRAQELNIFTLYEQNIGMVTPMIAEELKEAERMYPQSWIEDAFREAVSLNHRSWRYISRILERWAESGRGDGESRRDSKEDLDPREYLRRYGHFLRR